MVRQQTYSCPACGSEMKTWFGGRDAHFPADGGTGMALVIIVKRLWSSVKTYLAPVPRGPISERSD